MDDKNMMLYNAGIREIPIITMIKVGFLNIAFHSLNIFSPFLHILSKILI